MSQTPDVCFLAELAYDHTVVYGGGGGYHPFIYMPLSLFLLLRILSVDLPGSNTLSN
jgi:hypothetical protein